MGVIKCSKIDCDDGCTTLNILKTIKLCILNGWALWHVNYISKIVKKEKEKNPPCLSKPEKFGLEG